MDIYQKIVISVAGHVEGRKHRGECGDGGRAFVVVVVVVVVVVYRGRRGRGGSDANIGCALSQNLRRKRDRSRRYSAPQRTEGEACRRVAATLVLTSEGGDLTSSKVEIRTESTDSES